MMFCETTAQLASQASHFTPWYMSALGSLLSTLLSAFILLICVPYAFRNKKIRKFLLTREVIMDRYKEIYVYTDKCISATYKPLKDYVRMINAYANIHDDTTYHAYTIEHIIEASRELQQLIETINLIDIESRFKGQFESLQRLIFSVLSLIDGDEALLEKVRQSFAAGEIGDGRTYEVAINNNLTGLSKRIETILKMMDGFRNE